MASYQSRDSNDGCKRLLLRNPSESSATPSSKTSHGSLVMTRNPSSVFLIVTSSAVTRNSFGSRIAWLLPFLNTFAVFNAFDIYQMILFGTRNSLTGHRNRRILLQQETSRSRSISFLNATPYRPSTECFILPPKRLSRGVLSISISASLRLSGRFPWHCLAASRDLFPGRGAPKAQRLFG